MRDAGARRHGPSASHAYIVDGGKAMIELTQEEQEYVVAILKSAHTELLRDLSHTDSRGFRRGLHDVIEMNERIAAKVSADAPVHDWNHRTAQV
jgi:hypothetical protein